MAYDPLAFTGAAGHYARGRPPYSDQLPGVLVDALGLDGTGRLLDVGCGPGTLTVALAPHFAEAFGLDPEPGMLDEARRRAGEEDVEGIHWLRAVAEDIPDLPIDACRLVTFGQSLHRTRRRQVLEAVYDLLEPGGAVALVAHTREGRPAPPSPGYPEVPDAEVQVLIRAYLGERPDPRDGDPLADERFEESLARSRFGTSDVLFAPGHRDRVRTVDSVVDNYFSMSYAAPPLFGDRRDAFEADLRAMLERHALDGLFWDWPGDTEIVVARR